MSCMKNFTRVKSFGLQTPLWAFSVVNHFTPVKSGALEGANPRVRQRSYAGQRHDVIDRVQS